MDENSEASGDGKNITVAKTHSSLIVDEETAKKRVAEFEEMFSDRFSEEDAEYVAYASKPVPHPPCVENFYTRQRRNYYDRSRHGQGHRGRGSYHGDNRDRGNYRGDRDRDRRDRNHPYGDRRYDNRSEQGSRYHPYQHGSRQYQDNRNRHGDRY